MGRPMGGPERIRRTVEGWPAEYKFTFTGGEPTLLYDLIRSQDGEAGISLITRALAKARMKPPLAEATWSGQLGRTNFTKVWGIRADYVTPRDVKSHGLKYSTATSGLRPQGVSKTLNAE